MTDLPSLKHWSVAVVEHDTEKVVRSVKCASEREAERVERGLNINLDHRFYYTEIVAPALLSKGSEPASAIREAETPVTPPAKGETR